MQSVVRFAVVVFALLSLATVVPAQVYDLVIRNARVVDGTGNPWFRANVGIKDGRIASVERRDLGRGEREIDASGLVLAPGFVDVHTHIESSIFRIPEADNFLFDGVTTVVTGNCGGSALPLGDFFRRLEEARTGINIASLIGHNTVRNAVLGSQNVQPTSGELARMAQLVSEAMNEGAVGLSTGLIYLPGLFAKTEEVVALARIASSWGGVYATHMRHERTDGILAAVDEAIHIGAAAGLPVQISHLKVGQGFPGLDQQVLARIDAARGSGLQVTADQYPYAASSTTLATILPDWAVAGGESAQRERLAAPETRRRVAAEIRAVMEKAGRANLDYIAIASHEPDPSLNGKRVPAITAQRMGVAGLDGDIDTVLDLLAQPGRTSVIYHSWSEPGVELIMRHPVVAVASDGGVQKPGPLVPHPRSYGTNARVLGFYAREKGILSLEEAVRKMTSLPAQTFRLNDRGLVLPGYAADLVLFDEARVRDLATYDEPHQYSEGFAYVLVNGVVVIENGQRNENRPGQVLRNKALH
ncbi:MAG: D-aminoacylase [Bryobacterales bacterium]|nr:D-aminoacylase [Bryobacterales bacterium]